MFVAIPVSGGMAIPATFETASIPAHAANTRRIIDTVLAVEISDFIQLVKGVSPSCMLNASQQKHIICVPLKEKNNNYPYLIQM